jgi:hypothetical protein
MFKSKNRTTVTLRPVTTVFLQITLWWSYHMIVSRWLIRQRNRWTTGLSVINSDIITWTLMSSLSIWLKISDVKYFDLIEKLFSIVKCRIKIINYLNDFFFESGHCIMKMEKEPISSKSLRKCCDGRDLILSGEITTWEIRLNGEFCLNWC